MDKSTVITLISATYERDDIGQEVPKEARRDVFCDVMSVGMNEWYEAGRNGFKPDYKFVMNRFDYEGETEIEYLGKRYGVYRTYLYKTDGIELYVEKKAGVQ